MFCLKSDINAFIFVINRFPCLNCSCTKNLDFLTLRGFVYFQFIVMGFVLNISMDLHVIAKITGIGVTGNLLVHTEVKRDSVKCQKLLLSMNFPNLLTHH